MVWMGFLHTTPFGQKVSTLGTTLSARSASNYQLRFWLHPTPYPLKITAATSPAGPFQMGDATSQSDENPVHSVNWMVRDRFQRGVILF
jgi:hypothetical protein